MLVHEAAERLKGRVPGFGDAEDVEAVRLLTLHGQAVHKADQRLTVPAHLAKKRAELEQADAATLEAYLHPPRKPRKGRPHGG
jgi:hypothetical protein